MIRNKISWLGFGRLGWNKSAALALLAVVLLLTTGTVSSHPRNIPTISITSVKEDESVTIQTHNFPAGLEFVVRMGEMYTRGLGGEIVTEKFSSGDGGSFDAIFDIPDNLKGNGRIAIRLDSTWGGFYSYNWFYNNTANVGTLHPVDDKDDEPNDYYDDYENEDEEGDGEDSNSDESTSTPPVEHPRHHTKYHGIPTITICEVTEDSTVTILTRNFPLNQTFAVTMGPMYKRGLRGHGEQVLNSEGDTSERYVFDIPDEMKGAPRIAIRTQTGHRHPYYSFNWFYNNTTTMDHCSK